MPPVYSVYQSFRERVGQVFNTEHLHLNFEMAREAPALLQLSKEVLFAPMLINRQPQLNVLKDRLEMIAQKQGGGPLLVILPGSSQDLPQAFVLRCGIKELQEEYDPDGGWQFLGRLTWPSGARNILPLLRTIRDGLGLPKYSSQEEIESRLAESNYSLCFSHFVGADEWSADGQKLVLSWIDYMCKGWPSLRRGRFVVAFLCIEVPNAPPRSRRAIQSLLNQLERDYQAHDSPILVASRLTPIRQRHVGDWVDDAGRYLRNDDLRLALVDLARKLFDAELKERPLAEIYDEICQLLNAALTRTTARTST